MKKVTVVAIVLLGIAGVIWVNYGRSSRARVRTTPAKAPSLSPEKIAGLVSSYKAASTPQAKVGVLEKLLRDNSLAAHTAFFSLLNSAAESELDGFRTALATSGTGEVFAHMVRFLRDIAERGAAKSSGPVAPGGRDAPELSGNLGATMAMAAFGAKLQAAEGELKQIARKNQDFLVAQLKQAAAAAAGKGTEKLDEDAAMGATLGLVLLGEDGFAAALAAMQTIEEQALLVAVLVPQFGPNAVVPAMKQYENPKSTEDQRMVAAIVMRQFPASGPVTDKVVEAYKHGRYFDADFGTKKPDGSVELKMEDFLKAAEGAWWAQIEGAYEGNKEFVKYVATKHLPLPDRQEKAIYLLAKTDFAAAEPYFEKLDFNALSDESLDALELCVHGMTGDVPGEAENQFVKERSSLFLKMFEKMEPQKREERKMTLSLGKFPADWQGEFIIANFGKMTDAEKNDVVFACGELPPETRKKVRDAIRTAASGEVRKLIDAQQKFEEEGGAEKKEGGTEKK